MSLSLHARRRLAASAVACATGLSPAAFGATPTTPAAPSTPTTPANGSLDEVRLLRQELAALRQQQEASLKALEARVNAAEAAAAAATATANRTATAAPATPSAPATPVAPVASRAATAIPAGGANAFNPAISLILSGGYTRTRNDPEQWAISGFALPADAEVGPGGRGFSLGETELGLSASIDPWLRGSVSIALADGEASIEEAYLQTTSLSHGLGLKAGRMFSGVGYLNEQHAHAWDFVDNPLAYQALLGNQLGDDGLQLRWLAPTDQFIELGAELGRGRGFPGGDNASNGAGMRSLFAHTGGDLGDSHSWRAGLSWLSARATDQSLVFARGADERIDTLFSGRTRVVIVDGVWKWAPGGNATRTSFKLQGEYLRSQREGALSLADGSAGDALKAVQSGWYLQGVWQFMPGWRAGLRTERLDAGRPDFGSLATTLGGNGFKPSRQTLMLDFNASEFSRVRLQFALDKSREGRTDQQLQLQYQMSLGAHGAHGY